jgi:hyaluronan synthase
MSRFISAAAMLVVVAIILITQSGTMASVYGTAVFALMFAKLGASLVRRPQTAAAPEDLAKVNDLTVGAIITVYNEDPEAFGKCLDSVLDQTRHPATLVVVDDASTDSRALAYALSPEVVRRFRDAGIGYQVVEFTENKGKRQGLAAGFRLHADTDIYLGIDSDTVLDKYAIERGMLPFASDKVNAVTGLVLALNARKNVLTRLIDLRYANAFLYERAAYSLLGAVLCCCGSLAFYRGTVVREHLHGFLNQRFLGRLSTFGDDRHMTNYCLLTGKAVLQANAVAWTLVPENVRHYLRQQVRWNKSFFRESLWIIRVGQISRPGFWLALLELISWTCFTGVLIFAMVMMLISAQGALLLVYLMHAMLLSYAWSARYLESGDRTRIPWTERLGTFLLAPLYGLLHMGVLLWVRVYSLCTLRDTAWGTRTGVEVSLPTVTGSREQPPGISE